MLIQPEQDGQRSSDDTQKTNAPQKVYGIDLGTCMSCIAVVDESDKPVLIANSEGELLTPSVVQFELREDRQINTVVGSTAKSTARLAPEATVDMIKPQMANENYRFDFEGQSFKPPTIAAFILKKLAEDAAAVTGEPVKDVVITIPAWFGVAEREATASAGRIAGLNVREIINEPTAAALSYGLDKGKNETVLVYDLGGGTFDVTVIEIRDRSIRVLCTGGEHTLGGRKWDEAIVNYLVAEFKQQTGYAGEVLDDPMTLQDLIARAEDAKKVLTSKDSTAVVVQHDGKVARVPLTLKQFDELTADLLERTIKLTKGMLVEAAKKSREGSVAKDVVDRGSVYAADSLIGSADDPEAVREALDKVKFNKILLVGGSTRMRQVERRLKAEFPVECKIHDPDQAVAKGAALYGRKVLIDGVVDIIINNTNKDRTAAQQEAAELLGLPASQVKDANETTIANVTSKSFGLVAIYETGERAALLIKANDPVPATVCRDDFGTSLENQTEIEIRVVESTRVDHVVDLEHVKEIGKFDMKLPKGLRKGSPIRVEFALNRQGRLEGSATDLTGKGAINFHIEIKGCMTEAEVQAAAATVKAIAAQPAS